MKKILFLISAFLILIPALTACGGKTAEKVVSYEIDPTKITGQTVEEKLDSFRNILNKKTEGFSRVQIVLYDSNIKGVGYYLMAYADFDEKYPDNVKVVLKQLFAYTVKFVDPQIEYVGVYVVDSRGDQGLLEMGKPELEKLKDSPPEAWQTLLEEPEEESGK